MSDEKVRMEEALSGVAGLYSENLKHHGLASRSVGWKDQESHFLRFEKLVQVIDVQPGTQNVTVNDLGCGYGAMFKYLDELPSLELAGYYGYDISDEMLAAAKKFIADPRLQLVKSPKVIHEADFSFVSGTFNVRMEASDEAWTAYVKDTLMNLADKSRKGLAFNLLTTYVDWKQEDLYYADPFMFFDFCKRNISRYVSLLHDYPLFEWTMLVRKEAGSR